MDLKHLSHNCIFQMHDFIQIPTMVNDKSTAPTGSEVELRPHLHHHHLLRSYVTNVN
jgi:hypothetical protein